MKFFFHLRHFAGRQSNTVQAMGWVLLAGLLFVVFTAFARQATQAMPAVEAAFLRNIFGLVIFVPVFIRRGPALLRTRRLGTHAVRGGLHGIAVLLWFYAITRINLSEVTAIAFTSPIFVTLGAAMFLGDRLRLRRVSAVVIGFFGILVIIRPGLVEVEIGALAVLASVPFFTASKLFSKSLTADHDSTTIVAYLMIFASITLALPAFWVWQTPSLEVLLWLAAGSVFATVSQLCAIRGIALAPLSILQPVEFLQLIWASLIGFYMFGQSTDIWVWVGGAIVVTSASYIARREAGKSTKRQ